MTSQTDEDNFYAERDRRMSIPDEGEWRLQPRTVHRHSNTPEISSRPSLAQNPRDNSTDSTSRVDPTRNTRPTAQSASNARQPRVDAGAPQIISRQPEQQRSGTSKPPAASSADVATSSSSSEKPKVHNERVKRALIPLPTVHVTSKNAPSYKRPQSPQPNIRSSKKLKIETPTPQSEDITEDISSFTEDDRSIVSANPPTQVAKATNPPASLVNAPLTCTTQEERINRMKFILANGTASFKKSRKKDSSLDDRKASSAPDLAQPVSSAASSSAPAPKRAAKPDKQSKASAKAKAPKPTVTKSVAGPRGKKNQEPRMMPKEYAQHLVDQVAEGVLPKTKWPKVLTGKTIFYCSGDYSWATERTRRKMDILIERGATLQPEFDPSTVTHIITDALEDTLLKAIKLEDLEDIPAHVPTLKWSWVAESINSSDDYKKRKNGTRIYNLPDYGDHAAFVERFEAGLEPLIPLRVQKGKKKQQECKPPPPQKKRPLSDTESESDREGPPLEIQSSIVPSNSLVVQRDASSTNNGAPLPVTPPASPPSLPHQHNKNAENDSGAKSFRDGLDEFYVQAREEQELGIVESDAEDVLSETDVSDDESVAEAPRPKKKRGWTCDKREGPPPSVSPNQDVVDKLTELMELHRSQTGDDHRWRAFSYQKCLKGIREYPKRIKSLKEASKIAGVGSKTAAKIMEIIQTGELRRIGYETTEAVVVSRLFMGIYGVGQHIALRWFMNGCRTLEDVNQRRGGIKLSTAQEIGLKFYEDINTRMPRAEAQAIFDLIKPIALGIDGKLTVDIMGSFRRGKADCGDIDILVTRPTDDERTHAGVMGRLLKQLHKAGILTEDLSMPDNVNELECCYRGLCKLPTPGSRRRRIDILMVPWTCRGAALIYYTGDDIFNRAMRMKANKMGYSLNQRGLFGGVVRDPTNRMVKLNSGYLVASETEEEIFKMLDVVWQEPHERIRNFDGLKPAATAAIVTLGAPACA